MVTIKQYHFPEPEDISGIERKRNELFYALSNRKLDVEEIDWLDWAETILIMNRFRSSVG